ncbi:MAG: ATP-binding protein, partial [bacterium]
TLQRKLTLLFGVIIVAVVLAVGGITVYQGREMLIEQARRTGTALAGSIAAAASNDFFNYNYIGLEQKAEEAARDPEVAYIILYDKEGQVAAYSGQGAAGPGGQPAPLEPAVTESIKELISEGFIRGYTGRGLDILVPVTLAGTGARWGSVRLGLRLDRIYSRISLLTWIVFTLCLVGVFAGWAASALFTKRITIPLENLVGAAVRVSEGDYDTRIEVVTGDEVQELADNFNWMTQELKKQRAGLEENLDEIKRLKHFSDLVILSITNGLITMDRDGYITSFNRMAEQILDTPAEKALGKSPYQVWGDTDAVSVMASLLQGEDSAGEVKLRWTAKDKSDRILEMSATVIRESDGKAVGHLALFSDLTEKKELEDRVKRTDRLAALGTLAAGLAHEIKNPLTAIRTFVQLMPERHKRADFLEKFNRTVPRELDRVNNLLEDLLDLVRRPTLNITRVQVGDLVDHILETLEPEIEMRGVVVDKVIDAGTQPVRADAEYLSRAIFNIVLNAVQAMPQGGTLRISSEVRYVPGEEEAVLINISDDGFGIPEEYIDQIFNPFFTDKEKGTGLGLAVTNKIIEDQDGSITVKSERGKGTDFTINLPVFHTR